MSDSSTTTLPASARAWIVIVTAAGAAVTALVTLRWGVAAGMQLSAVLLCAGVTVLEWPFRALLRAVGEPDPWAFLGPMVVWLVGMPWAPVLAVVAVLGSCALDGAPLRKRVFNSGLRATQAVFAGVVVSVVAGATPPLPAGMVSQPRGVVALLLAQVAWWASGWVLVSVMVALASATSLARELRTGVGRDFLSSFLFAVVGPVALLALAYQPLILPLLALPLGGAIATGQRAWRRRQEARTDALTGLPNRLSIYEETRAALYHAGRRGLSAAICLIDLDGFKPVNDTHGHETGDAVLRALSRRLEHACADERSFAGRLGGDEFFVLWRDHMSQGDYRRRAEVVHELLREPLRVERTSVTLDASLGVAVFPSDGGALDALLRRADRAMYRAKAGGGGVAMAGESAEGPSRAGR